MNDTSIGTLAIIFLMVLTILFIGLKLASYIQWSWWWVLSPLWGGTIVGLVLLGSFLLWIYFSDMNNM